MARSVQDILKEDIGDLHVQIAMLKAKIEELTAANAKLTPTPVIPDMPGP